MSNILITAETCIDCGEKKEDCTMFCQLVSSHVTRKADNTTDSNHGFQLSYSWDGGLQWSEDYHL